MSRWTPVLVTLLSAGVLLAVEPPRGERNLYEWCAVAPIVAAVQPLDEDGRWVNLEVERVLRGPLDPGARIRVDRKAANQQRGSRADPLKLDPDTRYVVLLEPSPRSRPGEDPAFDFVRGVRGARALPKEGADAVLDALAEFVEVQDVDDFDRTWARFRDLLEGINPLVIDTVLDQYLKFGRGDRGLLEVLEPLLDHPRTEIREKTARLLGLVLEQASDPTAPEFAPARTRLLAKARRDPQVEVRVAATAAVARVPGPEMTRILREIADRDPDQAVRYEAERLLLDRSADRAGATRD